MIFSKEIPPGREVSLFICLICLFLAAFIVSIYFLYQLFGFVIIWDMNMMVKILSRTSLTQNWPLAQLLDPNMTQKATGLKFLFFFNFLYLGYFVYPFLSFIPHARSQLGRRNKKFSCKNWQRKHSTTGIKLGQIRHILYKCGGWNIWGGAYQMGMAWTIETKKMPI